MVWNFFYLIILLHFIAASTAFAGTVNLPRTGQITCYDSTGTIISCTGTGQDGELQKGIAWPAPRFTVNADTTITDNLTGLIWDADATTSAFDPNNPDLPCTPNSQTWQNALAYVACLNANSYLGYTDWRLPNVNEMESIIDAGAADQILWLQSQGFDINSAQQIGFWTSTTSAASSTVAWFVNIWEDGYLDDVQDKSSTLYIWPVRGTTSLPAQLWKTGQTTSYALNDDGASELGVAWPSPRFTDNGDGTVKDNLTNIVWAKEGLSTCGYFSYTHAYIDTWQGTLDYVKCLNTSSYLGHTDWRLPNRKELRSIADYSTYNPALPAGYLTFFPYVKTNHDYWSSTTVTFDPSQAWAVYMYDGALDFQDLKSASHYAWPVCNMIGMQYTLNISGAGSNSTGTVTGGNSISCSIASNGTTSGTCAETRSPGTSIALTATPGTHTSVTWLGCTSSSGNTCNVTLASDTTVTAKFLLNTYTVTPSADPNGSISPSTPQTVNYNATTSFTLTPNTGYHIGTVTGCGGTLSGSTYTTGPITANCTISATFAPDTYTISASAIGGGAISCTPAVVNYGDSSFCTIRPNSGYHLQSLTDNSVNMTGSAVNNSYVINNVTSSHTISAIFSNTCSISAFTPDGNGTVSCNPNPVVVPGADSVCTITPSVGYQVDTVTVDGGTVTTINGMYTFGNVITDHSITVTFKLLPVKVTGGATGYYTTLQDAYNAVSDGGIIQIQALVFNENLIINRNISVALKGGYDSAFTSNSSNTTLQGSLTIISGTLTVERIIISSDGASFTVTPSVGSNGYISPSSPQTVSHNSMTSFTVTPATGYHIASISGCGGTSVGAQPYDSPYTYTTGQITADCAVSAAFAINTYSISSSASGGNGTVSCTPTIVNYGSNSTCTITPNTGYSLQSLTDNSSDVTTWVTGNSYTITNISSDHTVSAAFAINSYTVTPSADTNGSITPSSPQTVNYNAATSFTVTPNTGYHINSISGCNGTPVGPQAYGASYSYTTGPITANCTVSATFAINTYSVTPSAGSNGSISPSSAQTVNYNATTSFTVTPDTGYFINTVTGCGGTLSGNTYTTGPITADCTVSATFATGTVKVTAPDSYYSTLQAAYNAVADGNIIESQAIVFTENLNINRSISVTLKGGYDTTFTSNSSNTTISGSLTISSGTLTVENLIVQ